MSEINFELPSVKTLKNFKKRNLAFFETDSPTPSRNFKEVYVEEPVLCTHCQRIGDQVCIEISLISGENSKFDAIGLYGCKFCKESTISFFKFRTYYADIERETFYPEILVVVKQEPQETFSVDIAPSIQDTYQEFTEIFDQAKRAENIGLSHLAGMGYRKAIEFLVTDFLKDYPTDESVTKEWLENPKTQLSQKVSKLPSSKLIRTAKAVTSLGNDETHYTIRHPNYNLQHMKRFISLLLKEIESEHIYKDVEDFLG